MCSVKGKEELFTSVFIIEQFFMGFLSYFLWFDDGSMDILRMSLTTFLFNSLLE